MKNFFLLLLVIVIVSTLLGIYQFIQTETEVDAFEDNEIIFQPQKQDTTMELNLEAVRGTISFHNFGLHGTYICYFEFKDKQKVINTLMEMRYVKSVYIENLTNENGFKALVTPAQKVDVFLHSNALFEEIIFKTIKIELSMLKNM